MKVFPFRFTARSEGLTHDELFKSLQGPMARLARRVVRRDDLVDDVLQESLLLS